MRLLFIYILTLFQLYTGISQTLLVNSIDNLPLGPVLVDIGAHTEYHFLPEAVPKGDWTITTFRHNLPPSWYVRTIDNRKALFQKEYNKDKHWHPMIIAG